MRQHECNTTGMDERFRSGDWEAACGREQSRGFMNTILRELDEYYLNIMKQAGTIVDVGCALGDGTAQIASMFLDVKVTGTDRSVPAIIRGRTLYPGLDLRCAPIEDTPVADVVICSNVLEHFEDPREAFGWLATRAQKLLVLLVPYNDNVRQGEHESVITADTLPEQWGTMFRCLSRIIDTQGRGVWEGEQLLQVYERSST